MTALSFWRNSPRGRASTAVTSKTQYRLPSRGHCSELSGMVGGSTIRSLLMTSSLSNSLDHARGGETQEELALQSTSRSLSGAGAPNPPWQEIASKGAQLPYVYLHVICTISALGVREVVPWQQRKFNGRSNRRSLWAES